LIDERREFLEVLIQNDHFNTLPTHDIDAEEEDVEDQAETFGKRHFDLYLEAKRIDSLQPELPTAMRYVSYTEALGTNINSFILKNKLLGRISILNKFSSPDKIVSGVIGKELTRLDQLQTTANKPPTEDTKAEENTKLISGFDPEHLTTKQSLSKGFEFTDSTSKFIKEPIQATDASKSFRMVKLISKKPSGRSLNKNQNKATVFNRYYQPALITTNEYWTSKREPSIDESTATKKNPLETRTLKRLKTESKKGKKKITDCKVDCDDYFKDFIFHSLDVPQDTTGLDKKPTGLLSFDE
jgi:hypothetical protein